MATGGDKPEAFKPRFAGDRATAPTPLEDESERAWQEFMQLSSVAPLASDPPAGEEQPAGAAVPQHRVEPSVEQTLALVRRDNRACPKAHRWQQLHELLTRAGLEAPFPVRAQDWKRTSALRKRLLVFEQIQWAAGAGALGAVHDFLAALPEEDWEHMG
ncbi:MAG: hypothetical protein AVDCRST_MAG51-2612 [uncultured Ramlibacter sp.]|uniref:Uncharacterized protein n=1 Tax=uncultured Ramlibacter sp. TaxID=260755 RepID=A0A6J4Q0E0_9BURK|nr:MAG: hypothetical protein AVDCRST_MAG51-2612 [uncultured Ramlibacter sp.]